MCLCSCKKRELDTTIIFWWFLLLPVYMSAPGICWRFEEYLFFLLVYFFECIDAGVPSDSINLKFFFFKAQ